MNPLTTQQRNALGPRSSKPRKSSPVPVPITSMRSSMRRKFRYWASAVALLLMAPVIAVIGYEVHAVALSTNARHSLDIYTATLVAAEKISAERGPMNGVLGADLPLDPQLVASLADARATSDHQLDRLSAIIERSGEYPELEARVERTREALENARSHVDELVKRPLSQRRSYELTGAVNTMVNLVPTFLQIATRVDGPIISESPNTATPVRTALVSAHLREQAGLLGSRFTAALAASRKLTPDEQSSIERSLGRIEQLRWLVDPQSDISDAETRARVKEMTDTYFGQGLGYVRLIRDRGTTGDAHVTTAVFADKYVPYMTSIIKLRDEMLTTTDEELRRHHETVIGNLIIASIVASVLLLALGFAVRIYERRILRPLTRATGSILEMIAEDPAVRSVARVDHEVQALQAAIAVLKRHELERTELEEERAVLVENLRVMAATDALTGLLNRRAFEHNASTLMQQAPTAYIALIVFDVDHFKQVNDEFGHLVGDRALQMIGELAQASWRADDILARIGGEEFAVMMAVDSADIAVNTARRFCEALATHPIPVDDGREVTLTVSVGVVDIPSAHAHDLHEGLKQADVLLYEAKENGRNRVEHRACASAKSA